MRLGAAANLFGFVWSGLSILLCRFIVYLTILILEVRIDVAANIKIESLKTK